MSPLVDGGQVIVHVGGNKSGALMAFDGATGAVKWQWKGDGPAYASPVIASFGNSRQVITQSRSHLVGLSAANGALLWSVPFTTAYDQNIVTPIVSGDLVLYSGIDQPLTALRIRESAGKWTAERAWRADSVPMYMSTAVLSGGSRVRPDAPEQGSVLRRRSALRQGAVDDEGTRRGERGADCRGRAADGDHHRGRAGDRAARRGEVRRRSSATPSPNLRCGRTRCLPAAASSSRMRRSWRTGSSDDCVRLPCQVRRLRAEGSRRIVVSLRTSLA